MPGVAEVANFGGYEKQYALTFNQAKLKRYGVSSGMSKMRSRKTTRPAAGASLRGQHVAGGARKGQIENLEQITKIFIKSIGGTPIYLKDLAAVSIDAKVPNGIFGKDYQEPGVEGIVIMRKGRTRRRCWRAFKRPSKD